MARVLIAICLCTCLATLTGCTVYGQKPVKALADATGGEGLERGFWGDIRGKDWKAIGNHTASNFVFTSPSEKLNREAALAHFQKLDVKDFSISDLTSELNGTVFVVSYTITLRGMAEGQPLPGAPQRRMSVWHQQKSGWMMVAHAVIGNSAPSANSAPDRAP